MNAQSNEGLWKFQGKKEDLKAIHVDQILGACFNSKPLLWGRGAYSLKHELEP